jgi:hypothetical protein
VAELFRQVEVQDDEMDEDFVVDDDDDILNYEPDLCAICQNSLEDLTVGNDELELPCGHSYHSECIGAWAAHQVDNGVQSSCPQCRAAIE